MMNIKLSCPWLCGALIATSAAGAELTTGDAELILASAKSAAVARAAPGGAIAIVDAGGHLVAFVRLDGSFPAAAAVAEGKARTAAQFRKPTRVFEDLINNGRVTMTAVAAVTPFTPLQGGVPLVRANEVVGGIGVSGAASAQQDDEIAQAAADFAASLPATSATPAAEQRP